MGLARRWKRRAFLRIELAKTVQPSLGVIVADIGPATASNRNKATLPDFLIGLRPLRSVSVTKLWDCVGSFHMSYSSITTVPDGRTVRDDPSLTEPGRQSLPCGTTKMNGFHRNKLIFQDIWEGYSWNFCQVVAAAEPPHGENGEAILSCVQPPTASDDELKTIREPGENAYGRSSCDDGPVTDQQR